MASQSDSWSPQEAWRRFRLEAEAAKNYPLSYFMYIAQTHRDPLLEQLLPPLLYVKAVAIFDDSLELWLKTNGHRLARPYKNDLNGRLEYLNDKNILKETDRLHGIREQRNAIAHEPNSTCSWQILDQDTSILEKALVSLSLVRPTKKLEYFSERSAVQESVEPGILFFRTFTYGIKENGKSALQVAWTQKLHDD